MRILRALTFTAALLAAPLAPAQAPVQEMDWRFADPGAQLIGGLDVHGLLTSPLVKAALDQAAAKMGDGALVMQMALGTISGVSQIYFSVTGRNEDAEGLMMIKGTLDDAAARAFLHGGPSAGTKQPGMDMARIDADTILVGSTTLLSAAVRRMQRPASTTPNPLLARGKTLAGENDFWFGGTLPDIPAVAIIGGGIKGLALGVGLQQDFRFQVSLDMATAELAHAMAAQVQKSMSEARQTQPELDMKVDAKVEGTTLRVSASMEGDKVLKALTEKLKDGVPGPGGLFGAGPAKTASAPSPTRARTPAPPPAPQGPKTVKIFGLDDGPREVPFPNNQH